MKDSAISWTVHTYNPWSGCTKVSPGCDNCYAEGIARRFGVKWGPKGERRRAAASTLRQPHAWNRAAKKERQPAFVFCASMADLFDNKVDPAWREELFATIRATPWLTWQLLTKRPQNIRNMLPPDWGEGYQNVWIGVSAENQEEAKRRLPVLLEVPARVRFVSAEPLLEQISLGPWLGPDKVPWVIAGCETKGNGPGRPFSSDWARALRDECGAARVSFFYKQEIGADGKKVETPLLDGRRWTERPMPESPIVADLPLLAAPAPLPVELLAGRIDSAHQAVEQAKREVVAHAVEAGRPLADAKKLVGHGGWEEWLGANCAFSTRTAQAYMRLAREMPKLDPVKAQRVADLSLRDALAAVASDARNVRALPPPLVEEVLEAAPTDGLRLPLKRAVNLQRYVAARQEQAKQEHPIVRVPEPSAPPPRPAPDPELGWAVLELLGEHADKSPWLTPEIIRETLEVVATEVLDRGVAGARASFLHEYGDVLAEAAE